MFMLHLFIQQKLNFIKNPEFSTSLFFPALFPFLHHAFQHVSHLKIRVLNPASEDHVPSARCTCDSSALTWPVGSHYCSPQDQCAASPSRHQFLNGGAMVGPAPLILPVPLGTWEILHSFQWGAEQIPPSGEFLLVCSYPPTPEILI